MVHQVVIAILLCEPTQHLACVLLELRVHPFLSLFHSMIRLRQADLGATAQPGSATATATAAAGAALQAPAANIQDRDASVHHIFLNCALVVTLCSVILSVQLTVLIATV